MKPKDYREGNYHVILESYNGYNSVEITFVNTLMSKVIYFTNTKPLTDFKKSVVKHGFLKTVEFYLRVWGKDVKECKIYKRLPEVIYASE